MKNTGFLRRHALRIGLGLLLVPLLLLDVMGVMNLDFVRRLENYTYDLRLQWTMPGTVDKRIVIVDLDDKSLKQEGHWPWPRNKLAHMMDVLFDHYEIDVLGFDVVFPEKDESSGLASLEELGRSELKNDKYFELALNRLRPKLMYDRLFADSLKNRRVALGYYFRHDRQADSRAGTLPAPTIDSGSFDARQVGAVVATGYTANRPELQAAAATAGFFDGSTVLESDGVFRRVSMLQMFDGKLYQSLSLAVAELAMRQPKVELFYEDGDQSSLALAALKLGPRRIPVDADVAALIPYRGNQGSFVYVSASDVLHGKVAPDLLRGAIVLLGTTAPGLNDLRTTPVQENYAGVEVHANMIAAIMDGTIKQHPAYVLGLELVLLAPLGIFLAVFLPVLSPLGATLVCLAWMSFSTAANLYMWQVHNLIVPLASSLVMTAALFVFNMSYGFFVDSRSKRLLARLFGQYVPPELVDEMAKDPGAYSLEGSNQELTVLFSDVRGFTTISEGLDPRQLTQLMNDFLTPMTKVIHRHRGTIDKYMGDAIMAFWGAPLQDKDHARHALLAAMDMVAELEALQSSFKAKGWSPIKIGVGLNTGDMTVGNMGSEFRLAYTVMGDAVNLGSRLEGLTKVYGVQIIVSQFTRDRVPDFAFRELDCVRVKGKDRPVRIFEPMGPLAQLRNQVQEELDLHHDALQYYRCQNWVVAGEGFAKLRQRSPGSKLYALYAERIDHYINQPPPPDWDGAFTFVTK